MHIVLFHLGDWFSDVAHLKVLEEGLLMRSKVIYYKREKPFPADIKRICILLRISKPNEITALQNILNEFYILTDDGYRQTGCDLEIKKYHDALPEIQAKKANQLERQRRFREARSKMFEELRRKGIVPPYDLPNADLNKLILMHANKPDENLDAPSIQTNDDLKENTSHSSSASNQIEADQRLCFCDLQLNDLPTDWKTAVLNDWKEIHQDDLKAKWIKFSAHFIDKSDDLKTPNAWLHRWKSWVAEDAVRLISNRKRRDQNMKKVAKNENEINFISDEEVERHAYPGESYEDARIRLLDKKRKQGNSS